MLRSDGHSQSYEVVSIDKANFKISANVNYRDEYTNKNVLQVETTTLKKF